jgi:DNA-binding MarR family transcriptional regulator
MTACASDSSASVMSGGVVLRSASMSANSGAPKGQRATTDAVGGLEARLIATIPVVFRHLLSHARRRPAWRELTYQQYNVMRIIQDEGPLPPGEIARQLLVSAPVVTRLASALVEVGLVERGADPADRRTVRLALTATGRRRVSAMRRDLVAAAEELIAPLPGPRRQAVASALEELQVLLPGRRLTR